MLVLGIESSCDETAAAVVRDGREVLSNIVLSQVAAHRPYGGVVPEIASRAHVEAMSPVIQDAMQQADVDWSDLDQIAVTHGPGLASSLLIGTTAAKALAARIGCPLSGVNHLSGHLYSVFLDPAIEVMADCCPMIVLLVTGGHTMLIQYNSLDDADLLGQTLDDAVGEALDKGATLLGLGYPGGPEIEKLAGAGHADAYSFPRGLQGGCGIVTGGLRREYCFSFSGLKTALLYQLRDHPDWQEKGFGPDLAASYQEAAFAALLDRLERAVTDTGCRHMACVGGVAKNQRLRAQLDQMASRLALNLHIAPLAYCTDNAAMIAGLAGARALQDLPIIPVADVHPNLRITRSLDFHLSDPILLRH